MLPKPNDCIGCPLYGDGQGFVPDRIPEKAEVVFLLQNPGENEENGRRIVSYDGPGSPVTEPCEPQPVIGPTGYQLRTTFLPLAGLDFEEVGRANVLRCRMQDASGERSNNMPTGEIGRQAVEHCTRAYLRVPPSVRLIVAQGAHSWRLLGGPQPLENWRGFLMPEQYGSALVHGTEPRPWPVLATVHLADLRHRPKLDLPTRKDFVKIRSILDGSWPRPMPPRLDANTCTYDEMLAWFTATGQAPFMVVDTEYDPDTKALALIGLGIPGHSTPVIQYHWYKDSTQGGRRTDFLYWLRETVRFKTTVFQNVLADLPVLRTTCNMDWSDYARIEDTMQAHAVLWCELPHTLEFQASMDGQYPKVKHLAGIDLDLYNEGDVLETISVWEARLAEFSRDPASRRVYDTQMKVLRHLDRSMQVGLAVDAEKVPPAITKYRERVEAGEAMARAYCGWPLNLRSDEQLKVWLYEMEKMSVQKHPETKEVTTNADAIATLRNRYLPFDAREEEQSMSAEYAARRIEQGAHPLLEAQVLHAHADHVLGHYLMPLVTNV